jgi:hypothetical protein
MHDGFSCHCHQRREKRLMSAWVQKNQHIQSCKIYMGNASIGVPFNPKCPSCFLQSFVFHVLDPLARIMHNQEEIQQPVRTTRAQYLEGKKVSDKMSPVNLRHQSPMGERPKRPITNLAKPVFRGETARHLGRAFSCAGSSHRSRGSSFCCC